ncbi:MAG: AAA family ATPase [Thiohalobacteraceae bacterium]
MGTTDQRRPDTSKGHGQPVAGPALPRLLAALQRPDGFPHPVDGFTLLETHISFVLLTGPYAYKFKKPVDLGFLDFSTLEKRRFYCHEELRLNRRLAPELYEAVVAITGTPEQPVLDGEGPAIEYAVRMRQFAVDARLDLVSDRGGLGENHIDQLATDVAAFHRRAAVAAADGPFGTPAGVEARVIENFKQIQAHCDDRELLLRLPPLHVWSMTAGEEIREDLELRRREGWIRECHGDMHLANMALIDDRVVLFDALEFSADLRWIDPLSEIAFVYMDLDHRGHRALARRFLNNYLEAANDYQSLNLFRYYLVYRALVRAKVAAIAAHQHAGDPGHRAQELATFAGYLDRAASYCANPAPAPLILMHGLSGSGKSWLARQLVEALGAIRIRSDVERRRLLGMAPEEATDSGIASGAYSPGITRKTYQRLQALAYPILDAGFPAIIDATCLLRSQRAPLQRFAAVAGVPWVLLDVQAPEAVLRERITRRHRDERDASEATLAVLDHQLASAEPLTLDEQRHRIVVDTTGPIDFDTLARAIMARG